MYEFILWMCLAQTPECHVWQSVKNQVFIAPADSMSACEEQWKQSLAVPDPEGMKSRHICQPVEQPI